MIENQAVMNRIWCEVILEELTRFGVKDICIAPGSRSTPLTLEADANNNLAIHTHFDERGLGFLALGLAKASKAPVAIVVTSGTAVANLLPAIAEAKLTGEKLVVLSADRPQQLVGCGANQAIVQQGLFSTHVTAALNLPNPSENISLHWLLTSVDEAMHKQSQQGSAIHINCPFPEPLYSNEDKAIYQRYLKTVAVWKASNQRYSQSIFMSGEHSVDDDLFTKKGLIVVGSIGVAEALQALELAKFLEWPILCDPQSGVSSEWAHYDLWLQTDDGDVPHRAILRECEAVVQFGSRIISKRLNHWLEEHVSDSGCDYIYVSESADRNNPSHLRQTHYVANISEWIECHLDCVRRFKGDIQVGWADQIKTLSTSVNTTAQALSDSDDQVSELALACSIHDLLAQLPKKTPLFIGNSLFVRLIDMFSILDNREVYTNRGASGIDGLVATAAGVQRARSQPLVLFIGDTSLLYDLNSLALLTHQEVPVVIVVTNNDGGAIFDLLPVPKEQKQALYQMPHGYQFEYAAKQFGLLYDKPHTLSGCLTSISTHIQHGSGALIVEVQTLPGQASLQLKEFYNHIHAK
ncbi:2-succinyl-5-enolpyruvyl-6-hydroxy-3-cyclohexene-1-carboxylic-acid synthase [Vibrio sp. 10N.261.55.A7]|uniref:2-succinyl-5-enolpyruvyl-6-hydroxy-3- cyclohexene-1-carboxylic-acid synthase n=1 Tax=Vibrio sp. 10N.261.55.A7 TaxID=1880851 RepID=UPI000C82D1BB|nr:2-succinyl-5-enolpyruvyl-6-hydroxy-3-cyclohexene-1-carboxylic-acid synthase [Vibrio sp. 10N.261.55.A7]PMJ90876.1 2-succinyl-5-enolpyruvyl-6-hydroxy-3-cyclohexene-1-carboxylic-acid synthase [Vibrio sp. 10N.261.55.A7]